MRVPFTLWLKNAAISSAIPSDTNCALAKINVTLIDVINSISDQHFEIGEVIPLHGIEFTEFHFRKHRLKGYENRIAVEYEKTYQRNRHADPAHDPALAEFHLSPFRRRSGRIRPVRLRNGSLFLHAYHLPFMTMETFPISLLAMPA